MIKARDGADTKVVFVGPCLSKTRRLMTIPSRRTACFPSDADRLLEQRGISLEDPAEPDKAMPPVFSRVYPIPEGRGTCGIKRRRTGIAAIK